MSKIGPDGALQGAPNTTLLPLATFEPGNSASYVVGLIPIELAGTPRLMFILIWCPKRRRPVLVGRLAACCRLIITEVWAHGRWPIHALAIQPDHVHLLIQLWPTTPIATVVQACKCATSYTLRRQFPSLRRLPTLWTRSYFAVTVGSVAEEAVRHSILDQQETP